MTASLGTDNATGTSRNMLDRFEATRRTTENLCSNLEPEDFVIQSSPDVSPPKWHLAHTTWFFETFILKKYLKGYSEFNPAFSYMYNSYYETAGPFYPRPNRGLISRPSHEIILEYRKHVDGALRDYFMESGNDTDTLDFLIELGINHEQQHQELLLMDLKKNFSFNPLFYAYADPQNYVRSEPGDVSWLKIEDGIRYIGTSSQSFSFDNETPEHREYVRDFEIADRPVTNGEYMDFMKNGGYSKPEFWLSDGWSYIRQNNWNSPEYWINRDGVWYEFKLSGLFEVDLNEPVSHVSYYEADAFARWSGYRLPTEFEWETAANTYVEDTEGNFLESGILHPTAQYSGQMKKMFGDVWEWTSSAYLPYPGFKPLEGTLGEYNGKFMSGQMVLRGGSCLTPREHIRATYRNFFAPEKRWPVTGIRLARDTS